MGAIVLDTSVVLGLFDPDDALHPACRDSVRAARRTTDRFILPISVVAETLVAAARAGDAELELRRARLRQAFGPPEQLSEEIAVAAARLRARHRTLRLPDALVIATAQELDADHVLTGDKRWRDIDPRVLVVG